MADIYQHKHLSGLFSDSVMSNFLQLLELQQTRLPCPTTSLGASSNSCPLSRWSHPYISCSFVHFTCLQSFPASGSFQWVSYQHQMTKILELQFQHQSNELAIGIRWPKYWSFSPSKEYSGLISLKIEWFGLLLSKGLSWVFSSTTVQRHQIFGVLPSLRSSSHNRTWPQGLRPSPWL